MAVAAEGIASCLQEMRHFITVVILSLVASACDDAQTTQCQNELLATLKAPASFKRVKMDRSSIPENIHKPPYDSVTITYDAVNSFNAPLRDDYTCYFKPGTTDRIDNPFQAEIDKMTADEMNAADAALNAASNAAANASDAIEESRRGISPEGVNKLANAVEANKPAAFDACVEDAQTTEQYAQCDADYGTNSEADD